MAASDQFMVIDPVGCFSGDINYGSTVQDRLPLKPVQELRENDCCFLFFLQVRYHSRKKLTEQRPCISGQFVRQLVYALPQSEP